MLFSRVKISCSLAKANLILHWCLCNKRQGLIGPQLKLEQTIASIWRENMLGYLSADIICSEKRTVSREHSSRKTVSFEEQIMSKDKYAGLLSIKDFCSRAIDLNASRDRILSR